MLKPYHNIEKAIDTLYLRGIEIPAPLTFSEIGRALSVITSQFINSEKVNLRLFGYCSKLLRLLSFNQKENTSVADLCERAWTLGDIHTIAKAISVLWSVWHKSIDLSGINFIKKEVKAQCKYDNWNAKYQASDLSSVLAFSKIIENEFAFFLLDAQIHGSLSDMQKTPYSDLDVLLIIKGEVTTNVSALIDLREAVFKLLKCIRSFDSLQHHGLFILSEQEMSCYAESRFPLLLMDYATSLMGKPVHYFNTIEDKMQSAASLYSMANRISSIDKISSDSYNLKMYSSWIMLLPTMYYQLFNDYVYKAASFNLVKKQFDSYGWGAIDACSLLRQNWNIEEANDLTLLGIEPDIIKKAKKLSQDILKKLDNYIITDSLWNEINVGKQSKHYAVDYHPVYYNLEEYSIVENHWAKALSEIKGIHSVYSFGTNNPTCGISDLDLLLVLEDEFTDDIALSIRAVRKKFQTGIAGYIKWHEEIIVEKEDLYLYANLWEPIPRFLRGKENLLKDFELFKNRAPFRKILLFKEGFFQFIKMMEFFYMTSVPLRLILLRCNSIRYDIKIVEEELGIIHPASVAFLENIESLRQGWFSLNNNERLKSCRDILITGLRILHYLLSQSSLNSVISENMDIFRGSDPEIDLGMIKIIFKKVGFKNDNPKNVDVLNKVVQFPIELFPIVELCLQKLKTDSQFNLQELSNTIKADLREKILIFQDIWAKGLEFEEMISKSN